MLSLNCKVINFQQPEESAYDKLMGLVKAELPTTDAPLQQQPQQTDDGHCNASFQVNNIHLIQ